MSKDNIEITEAAVKAINQENICKGCGRELLALPWCDEKTIFVCDNWWCQLYRCPAGSVKIKVTIP